MIILDKSITFTLTQLKKYAESEGVAILIDKQIKWTSFDIVAKLRVLTRIKKIGHAGTLDPLATGLLILCLGRQATKKIIEFQELPKKYLATLKLGATTRTDDAEEKEENIKNLHGLDQNKIIPVINSFKGTIEQIPPIFSAKKIAGKRAHQLARNGKEPELKPVKIQIHNIEIKKIDLPYIEIKVECSKGTYIRSLARDIGLKIGCGAYITELRRITIGHYHVNNAFTINELTQKNQ
jgi:tRNA pseudouridine55 synthase